jgi:hypothetical protein
MKRTVRICTIAFVLAVLQVQGCGPKVMVPPNVDLAVFESVGLIDFTSNVEGNFADYATQRFLEIVTASQPGARFIEIGTEDDVLRSVGADKMDLHAVRAIGELYEVEAVIIGNLDVSEIKPRISLSPGRAGLGVEAEIEATLTSKLYDTYDGATVWTSSAKDRQTVAHVGLLSGGDFYFNADDPAKAYGGIIDALLEDVTYDLRVRYERR